MIQMIKGGGGFNVKHPLFLLLPARRFFFRITIELSLCVVYQYIQAFFPSPFLLCFSSSDTARETEGLITFLMRTYDRGRYIFLSAISLK